MGGGDCLWLGALGLLARGESMKDFSEVMGVGRARLVVGTARMKAGRQRPACVLGGGLRPRVVASLYLQSRTPCREGKMASPQGPGRGECSDRHVPGRTSAGCGCQYCGSPGGCEPRPRPPRPRRRHCRSHRCPRASLGWGGPGATPASNPVESFLPAGPGAPGAGRASPRARPRPSLA